METPENYLNELHQLCNKFEARIRTDFHAQFAEIRDVLIRKYNPDDGQKLAVTIFNLMYARFICLGPCIASDKNNFMENPEALKMLEVMSMDTFKAQCQALREELAARKTANIQTVTEAPEGKPIAILPGTHIVEIATVPGAGKILAKQSKKGKLKSIQI